MLKKTGLIILLTFLASCMSAEDKKAMNYAMNPIGGLNAALGEGLGKVLIGSLSGHQKQIQLKDFLIKHGTYLRIPGIYSARGTMDINTKLAEIRGEEFKHLQAIRLSGSNINGKGLAQLWGFPIRHLYLDDTPIKDRDLEMLRIPSLEELDLYGTAVSDKGIVHLQSMTALRDINLKNTQVTMKGIQKLRKICPKVRIHYCKGSRCL